MVVQCILLVRRARKAKKSKEKTRKDRNHTTTRQHTTKHDTTRHDTTQHNTTQHNQPTNQPTTDTQTNTHKQTHKRTNEQPTKQASKQALLTTTPHPPSPPLPTLPKKTTTPNNPQQPQQPTTNHHNHHNHNHHHHLWDVSELVSWGFHWFRVLVLCRCAWLLFCCSCHMFPGCSLVGAACIISLFQFASSSKCEECLCFGCCSLELHLAASCQIAGAVASQGSGSSESLRCVLLSDSTAHDSLHGHLGLIDTHVVHSCPNHHHNPKPSETKTPSPLPEKLLRIQAYYDSSNTLTSV